MNPPAEFEKGYLRLSSCGTSTFLENGVLFRMIYEFQTGYSVADQIKELLTKVTERHEQEKKKST